MAVTQIPNLGGVASIGGADLYESVQAGVSVKVTAAQIAAYTISVYPYPLPSVVNTFSAGATGLSPSIATSGDVVLSGTLNAAHGGTGFSTYTIGDLLYADTTTSLAKLADVATGSALVSGGIGAAPSWAALSTIAVSSISFGSTGLTPATPTMGAVVVSGTLNVATGGTGVGTFTSNGILYGNGTGAVQVTAAGTTGQVLIGNTGLAPSWATISSTLVSSISFGTTGLTPSSATTGAVTVAGTLVAANGGTGQNTYAVGDILYASTTTALSRLADVATGNALLSGGIGVAPTWGKVSLTAAVSGILPPANGGTGVANNAASTVTISGNFALTLTLSNTTSVTLPTTGTLATLAGAEVLTNKTITTFGGALTFNPANANFTLSPTGTGTGAINPATTGTIDNMTIGGSTPKAVTGTTISDSVGNVRSIIHSGSDKVTTYSLLATDNGQYISLGASGAITIPNSTFADGNVVSVFNNTASDATITVNTTTGYIGGINTNKGGGGTVTLATRGVCTILFLGSTSCVISGNVS